MSKTDSVSDVEPTEDEATPTSSKISTKQKKKKSPGKGKKRRSSSVTDPDFVLRTPKRKAAKRDVSKLDTVRAFTRASKGLFLDSDVCGDHRYHVLSGKAHAP